MTRDEIENLIEQLDRPVDWAHFAGDDYALDYQELQQEAATAFRSLLNPWRPISEAPKDGTWILAYYPKPDLGAEEGIKLAQWRESYSAYEPDGFVDVADHEEFGQPTHFMPLPPPPAGGRSAPATSAPQTGVVLDAVLEQADAMWALLSAELGELEQAQMAGFAGLKDSEKTAVKKEIVREYEALRNSLSEGRSKDVPDTASHDQKDEADG